MTLTLAGPGAGLDTSGLATEATLDEARLLLAGTLSVSGSVTATASSASAGSTGQQAVTTEAVILATSMAGRRAISLRCLSTSERPLFFGFTPDVTTADGYELAAGEGFAVDLEDDQAIYVVAASTAGAGVRCCWAEVA